MDICLKKNKLRKRLYICSRSIIKQLWLSAGISPFSELCQRLFSSSHVWHVASIDWYLRTHSNLVEWPGFDIPAWSSLKESRESLEAETKRGCKPRAVGWWVGVMGPQRATWHLGFGTREMGTYNWESHKNWASRELLPLWKKMYEKNPSPEKGQQKELP